MEEVVSMSMRRRFCRQCEGEVEGSTAMGSRLTEVEAGGGEDRILIQGARVPRYIVQTQADALAWSGLEFIAHHCPHELDSLLLTVSRS